MTTPRLLLSVGALLVLVTGIVVYRDLTQMREQRKQAGALSRGEVPLDDVPVQPSPFLEDLPLAGAPEHALLLQGESDKPEFGILSGEAPPELPLSEEVEPVPLLTPRRRMENTAAIKKVLPGISDERLEFWLEETRDLPPEMIHDMLMFRKHFGALTESFSTDQSNQADQPDQPEVVEPDPVVRSLLRARSLILQNRMNEHSIGYLAIELVFVEDANTIPSGVRLADTRLSLEPGDLQFTERPLDVAFSDGRTFLAVREGKRVLLTRFGSLMIGADRRLRLAIEGTDLIVSPGIVIPEGSDEVLIAENGTVFMPQTEQETGQQIPLGKLELQTVREPAYLQPVGAACYIPTVRSGELIDLPGTTASEPLKPGCLQRSNVDSQHNGQMRRQIDDWLEVWNEQNPKARSPLGPIKQLKSWGGLRLDIF